MNLWVDAQLSPSLAGWISRTFRIEAIAVRDLRLRDAEDPTIFQAGCKAGVVVMTKDRDFLDLLDRFGPPPQVIWVTMGNTSNANMRKILALALPPAWELIGQGEALVEIGAVAGGAV